jgi:hypothetical protein
MISLIDLETQSPIDLTRVIIHARNFLASVNVRISSLNLDKAKKALVEARGHLDLMITTLYQVLYSREILKSRTDEVLYMWLIDNLGRFLRSIDEKENELLVFHDNPNEEKSLVGISRLSVYSKMLKTAGEALVFESLQKAISEYSSLKKEEQTQRTFLYILFSILQITLSALGGIARQKQGSQAKRGMISENPTTWQSLISKQGQESIAQEHEQKTGEKIPVPEELLDKEKEESEPTGEEIPEVIHDEMMEEENNE